MARLILLPRVPDLNVFRSSLRRKIRSEFLHSESLVSNLRTKPQSELFVSRTCLVVISVELDPTLPPPNCFLRWRQTPPSSESFFRLSLSELVVVESIFVAVAVVGG